MVMRPTTKQKQMITSIGTDCLMGRLRLLNRVVGGIYDEALRPHGIKLGQLTILVAVSRFGLATSQQISRALHMDPSTFSRALNRLKGKQWVQVTPRGEGKILNIAVTEAGYRMIAKVYPDWQKAQARAVDALGASTAEMILAAGNRHLLEGLAR